MWNNARWWSCEEFITILTVDISISGWAPRGCQADGFVIRCQTISIKLTPILLHMMWSLFSCQAHFLLICGFLINSTFIVICIIRARNGKYSPVIANWITVRLYLTRTLFSINIHRGICDTLIESALTNQIGQSFRWCDSWLNNVNWKSNEYQIHLLLTERSVWKTLRFLVQKTN